MSETLNNWNVSKDSINPLHTHFVIKCPFDNGGLSLMVEGDEYYTVELAIENNNSVIGCFRLANAASEKETINIVLDITETI